jgi:hypothetical protein
MGVTLDRAAALDLLLQLTNAAHELVIELTLLEQFLGLTRERAIGFSQLFGESGDDGLRGADKLRPSSSIRSASRVTRRTMARGPWS